jgi:hypothetical protein
VTEPVVWAVVFLADEDNPERMKQRMFICKDEARARDYAGDPTKPHEYPMRVRPLGFLDGDDNDRG